MKNIYFSVMVLQEGSRFHQPPEEEDEATAEEN